MASLPSKVAFRNEQGDKLDPKVSLQNSQRMAQKLAQAHEQTKAYVASQAVLLSAMLNQAFSSLKVDTTLAAGAYATLVSAVITTVLTSGHLVITMSMSGSQITNASVVLWQLVVDGVVLKGGYTNVALNNQFSASMVMRAGVLAGKHTVALQVKTTSSSVRFNATSVNEEHANLLIQEAA